MGSGGRGLARVVDRRHVYSHRSVVSVFFVIAIIVVVVVVVVIGGESTLQRQVAQLSKKAQTIVTTMTMMSELFTTAINHRRLVRR